MCVRSDFVFTVAALVMMNFQVSYDWQILTYIDTSDVLARKN